ncbi:MAG: biotin transporter BioY [bacterium]|nr:biotin transporter BioY [bacterium]
MTTKRIAEQINNLKYKNQPLKLSFGVLVLIAWCTFLIVISTFTQLNFTKFYHAIGIVNPDSSAFANQLLLHSKFIPQIPMIMFVVVLLGREFGIFSTILYIILGLFLAPVFALGGGIDYVFQFGFGYIVGYIPAMFFSGSILKKSLSNKNLLRATTIGVLTVHLIGILYMLFIVAIQKEDYETIINWTIAQSGFKIFYDLIFSIIAVYIAKYTKKILWVVLG